MPAEYANTDWLLALHEAGRTAAGDDMSSSLDGLDLEVCCCQGEN